MISQLAVALGALLPVAVMGGSPTTSISRPLVAPWYGHGGSMGFGPALLDDSNWSDTFRRLMPTEYADCTRKRFDEVDTMPHVENNPVNAAYAYETTRVRCGSSGTSGAGCSPDIVTQGFEWDLFLRPDATASNPRVDDILVAHGVGSKHLRKEQQGINQYYEVKAIKKTEMGGVVLSQWITLFTRALWMARNPSSKSAYQSRAVSWEDFTAAYLVGQPAGRAVPFTTVLDIKTGAASPALIKAVVTDLNSKGVVVSGVGSFDRNQIAGIDSVSQTVGTVRNLRPKPVLFYHGIRQRSIALLFGISAMPPQFLDDCDSGNIPRNFGIAFNGGFLIDYNSFALGKAKRESYKLDTAGVNAIAACKRRYSLSVGLYVQEGDIDRWALQIIFDAVRSYGSTFDLGFAWGGMPERWYTAIEPSLTDATVGTSSQSLLSSRVAVGVVTGRGDNEMGVPALSATGFALIVAMGCAATVALLAMGIVITRRIKNSRTSAIIDGGEVRLVEQTDQTDQC